MDENLKSQVGNLVCRLMRENKEERQALLELIAAACNRGDSGRVLLLCEELKNLEGLKTAILELQQRILAGEIQQALDIAQSLACDMDALGKRIVLLFSC